MSAPQWRGVVFHAAGELSRKLTHRLMQIEINRSTVSARLATALLTEPLGPVGVQASGLERRWVTREELRELGVSNAHAAAMEVGFSTEASATDRPKRRRV